MYQRKYVNVNSNQLKVDTNFGKLQDVCDGITFWNGLYVIMGSILLFCCVNYYINGLRSSDDMGHIVVMIGIVACIGAIAFGIYEFLHNRIYFYEYGYVFGKHRVAYDEIECITSRKVFSGSRSYVQIRNVYSIKKKDDNRILNLDSADFRGMNNLMEKFLGQVDVYIKNTKKV